MKTKNAMKKCSIPGRHLEADQRDSKTLDFLRAGITIAGNHRRSGAPEIGMIVLSGVVPALVRMIHHRIVGGGRHTTTASMIEDFRTEGVVSDEEFKLVRIALVSPSAGDTGRDITPAIRGAMILWALTTQPAFAVGVRARRMAEEADRGILRRWATAAAAMLSVGSSAS